MHTSTEATMRNRISGTDAYLCGFEKVARYKYGEEVKFSLIYRVRGDNWVATYGVDINPVDTLLLGRDIEHFIDHEGFIDYLIRKVEIDFREKMHQNENASN
ncbi:MAG: hypothetical protein CMH64_04440 [Nanoarchaeota archaeon]|nr:hypothetical protein [Nanoarchaeota archaeon]|tara:strand:+ start:572 stop:877 length:306 start_codon:yes stop_codon:yes gene_type:complete